MPAAMPFMVRMSVSFSPGSYSLLGFSFTSLSAVDVDPSSSLDSGARRAAGLNRPSWIRFSVYAWHAFSAVMYESRSISRCRRYGSLSRRSACPATCRSSLSVSA
uniref:Uncharacterized protein n=1 Tax=Arundo donax TaxID=35708 RepID=A0A0A8XRE7_ARUDO